MFSPPCQCLRRAVLGKSGKPTSHPRSRGASFSGSWGHYCMPRVPIPSFWDGFAVPLSRSPRFCRVKKGYCTVLAGQAPKKKEMGISLFTPTHNSHSPTHLAISPADRPLASLFPPPFLQHTRTSMVRETISLRSGDIITMTSVMKAFWTWVVLRESDYCSFSS
jgi:hypothetical protein